MSINPKLKDLKDSATLAINELSNELIRERRKVYKLGLGQSPFPVPVPVVRALRLHAGEKDYLPVSGLGALQEAVCDFHRRKEGIVARSQDVLVGPGSKELLFLLQLVYDSIVLLPTPCWVSYEPQAKIIGREIQVVQTSFESQWKLTAKALRESCEVLKDKKRPGLLILNYPNNPFGTSYSAQELQEIAQIAREFGLIILADEIYGELQFDGAHVSMARYYPEGTIISSGLSKWAGAGGWRLGTFVFPESLQWIKKAMCAVASETYTSVCAPVQYAAITAFRGGYEIDRYIFLSRKILKALGYRCYEILKEGKVRLHPPTGAFYLFVDFSQTKKASSFSNSKELTSALLKETGVAILPGTDFLRESHEMSARIAYVDFDGSQALLAAGQLDSNTELGQDFLNENCSNVIEAMEVMTKWLNS